MFSARIIRGFVASSSLRDIGRTRRTVADSLNLNCRNFCGMYNRLTTWAAYTEQRNHCVHSATLSRDAVICRIENVIETTRHAGDFDERLRAD
ncbi:hypothetical protein CAJAP_04788 [Camponotus japonicus]